MADDKTVVLDISSDDDAGWGNRVAACGFDDGGGVGCRDDGDWISELLGEVNEEKDDSDDVVVVGEVIVKPKLRPSKTLVKGVTKVQDDDDDDDDCVVLAGDPYKPTSIQNDREEDGDDNGDDDGDDSDDVLVVSEKGQVACRDYPHARHLCVKLPFNSTPHERHCDQCHCYVCDSLAPCAHWNTGITSIDHCHATDKDEFWKNMRKSARKVNNSSLPLVSGVPQATLSIGQYPPCQIPSSLPSEYEERYSLSSTVPCAMSQQPEYQRRDRYPSQWVPCQSQTTHNNAIRGDRRHIAVNAASQVISRTPFRRRARTVANQYCNDTSRSSYNNQMFRRTPSHGMVGGRWVVQQRGGGTPVVGTYSSRASTGGIDTNLMPGVSAHINLGSGTANCAPSLPQIFPQVHGNVVNRNTDSPQHQVSSGMFVASNLTSPMPAVSSESNWLGTFDNTFPYQLQANSGLGGAKISENYRPSLPVGSTIPSNMADCYSSSFPAQPSVVSGFQNSSAYQLSQVCNLATRPPLNAGENVLVHGNPTQSALVSSSTNFYQPEVCNLAAAPLNVGNNLSSPGDSNQGVMHSSSTGLDYNLDFHRSHSNQPLPDDQFQNSVQRDESVAPLDGNPELSMYSNLSPVDIPYDPWLFENERGLDAYGNPELNGYCPETSLLDAGLFHL